jgi:hypothetical protein
MGKCQSCGKEDVTNICPQCGYCLTEHLLGCKECAEQERCKEKGR